jgi:RNA polymerase sigma-70 factor (ECF subfamily)
MGRLGTMAKQRESVPGGQPRSIVIERQQEDRQLVDAVIAGDHEAFRALIDRESQLVIAVCHRMLGDPVEAQDVAQEAFLQAYRALATFRGDGPFGAWLRRIAIRAATARQSARREVVRLDAEALDPRAAALESGDDPEAAAIDVEQRAVVLDAVETLPDAQRDVILLRFYGELSLLEIAEVTRHPIGTVKSRLHRGMAALRDQLEPRSVP